MAKKGPAAERGSQAWIQRAVAARLPALEHALASAVGMPDDEVWWKSPVAPEFREARDGRAFQELGIVPSRRALKDFWPARGPVWDGLAVIGSQYVLLEAKAHIPELISGGSKAAGASLTTIRTALERTRKTLAPRSKADWATSPFFQYANRLAFLQYLREDNRIPAHLAFVYFKNDSVMKGPETEEEWRGALRLMDAALGLSSHRLSPFVHKIFVDTRALGITEQPGT